jgi:SAM-dependent methyltransferase
MNKVCVHYGCGSVSPANWINIDNSPTLILQNKFLLKYLFKKKYFNRNVIYGDIRKKMPFKNNSVDLLFCSHVLEHMTYDDCILSLRNSYNLLKYNGTFRIIMPDLNSYISIYLEEKNNFNCNAAYNFNLNTMLGYKQVPNNIFKKLLFSFRNSNHLFLWDYDLLKSQLEIIGFKNIKIFSPNNSEHTEFLTLENKRRFINSISIECKK